MKVKLGLCRKGCPVSGLRFGIALLAPRGSTSTPHINKLIERQTWEDVIDLDKNLTEPQSGISLEIPKLQVLLIRDDKDFPAHLDRQKLARFLHESLKPFEDTLANIGNGIDYALSSSPGEGGFILVAESGRHLAGALVVLRTGMKGYIPENILLFVAVASTFRRKGIGEKLIEKALQVSDGDVKLHVEHANPAKRLYLRLGFTNKYAEMRYIK